ncbi:MAG: lycopene cyclase domain-containing protein [Verrucomicrobiota bacterium]
MSYFQFHLFFNLPPLLVLLFLQRHHLPTTPELLCLGVIFVAVGLFTSPWDNHAVKKGIWGFPRDQHSFKIAFLPIEEYLFFFIQTFLVILSVRLAFLELPSITHHLPTVLTPFKGILALILFGGWIAIGKQWKKRSSSSRWNYTFHLFYWFAPMILFQWIIGAEIFSPLLGFLLLLSLGWGLYYTGCDLIATSQGIWHFDENQIQGWRIRGILPWEESAFFWMTSLLVAQSYILLLPVAFR